MKLLSQNQAQTLFNKESYEKYADRLADIWFVRDMYLYQLRNDNAHQPWLQKYYDNLIVATRVRFEEPV
jgi:hypothetical protein